MEGVKRYEKAGEHEEEEPGGQTADMGETQQTFSRVRKKRQRMAAGRIFRDNG